MCLESVTMTGPGVPEDVPVLTLASTSPRRRQLLTLIGWKFEVISADIDESSLQGETPADYVIRLAACKARACAEYFRGIGNHTVRLIVAADTAVVDGSNILGKPVDEAEAMYMLQRLRGRIHQVFTGIAILSCNEALLTDVCITEVPMRSFSEQEMGAYIASGDPMDKAGAYAIQHPLFRPVESLSGCYANVMGLPLCHLERALIKLGLQANVDVAQACQDYLGYQCQVAGLLSCC